MALKLADDKLILLVNRSLHHSKALISHPLLVSRTIPPYQQTRNHPAVALLHISEMSKPARWRKRKGYPEAKGPARPSV